MLVRLPPLGCFPLDFEPAKASALRAEPPPHASGENIATSLGSGVGHLALDDPCLAHVLVHVQEDRHIQVLAHIRPHALPAAPTHTAHYTRLAP